MQHATGLLEQVLAIWQEVLGRTHGELAPDSNFFLNGGDSLQLTRVLVRIGERLGVDLDLRDVARFSTPGKMARCCAEATRPDAALVPAPVSQGSAGSVPDRFPCSEGQAALWLAEQASDVALYNTAVVVHLTGDLQVSRLARALTLCVHRHEALRMRFEFDTHRRQLVAVVVPACDVALEVLSLPPMAASGYLRNVAAGPFDLARGPLWRFELVATGPRMWSLLLCVHHCITDGWSGSVLLRHVGEAYNALSKSPDWQPPGVEREFRGFCVQRPSPETGLRWWREQLRGAEQLSGWPLTGSSRWPFAMARDEFVVPGSCFPVQGEITPAALALTALRLALQDVAGLDELCIGMPANVRTNSAQETSVGYYVNLLVLRARIDAGESTRVFLHKVQRNLANALRHRGMPCPVLAQRLKPRPLPSGNPWCDILSAFQNLPQATLQLSGVHMVVEALTLPHGQHPLKVEFVQCGMTWRCRIEYARKVLSQADVRALRAALQRRLVALAAEVASSN